jgi:predicted P-loop ATPase
MVAKVIKLDVVQSAITYLNLGIEPVPVYPRSKQAIDNWKSGDPITLDNVISRFQEGQNIGMRLGRRSGGLVDVDLDCFWAIQLAPWFLPPTTRISGRPSSPRSHWYYRSDLWEHEDVSTLLFKDPDPKGEVLVELRIGADGVDGEDLAAMTVAPPSIHQESGETVIWHEQGEFPQVDGGALKRAVIKIALGCMLLKVYPEEGRHNFCRTIDGYLTRKKWTEEERIKFIKALATVAGDDEMKDRIKVCNNTEKRLSDGKRITGLRALRDQCGRREADAINEWLRVDERAEGSVFPDVTKEGRLRATRPNILKAMELLGVRCRYDLLALECVIAGDVLEDDGGRMTDGLLHRIWQLIYSRYEFDPPKNYIADAAAIAAEHDKFHPIIDYLDALVWDGVPRIDTWLTVYCGATDDELTRAISAIWMIAMVRRVRQPGTKFDEVLVFEGDTGIGKSSVLRELAVKPEWFTDSVHLGMSGRELLEQLQGKWVAEISELSGMKKAELERVKAMLSMQEDRARMAYAYYRTDAKRQVVFGGTTNDAQYLRDENKNRRYWPVHCTKSDYEAVREDIGQLLAEASVREAAGETVRLPPELWEAAAVEQEKRAIEDPWIAILDERLRGQDGEPMEGKISVTGIWEILDIRAGQLGQTHNQRMGAAMAKLGWKRALLRVDGQRQYSYTRGDKTTGGHRQICVHNIDDAVFVEYADTSKF